MKHKITLAITTIVLLISAYFLRESSLLGIVISLIVLVYVIILILGSSFIQFNYFVNSVNNGTNNGIAITCDDGPNPETTPPILAILTKDKEKA